MARVKVRRAYAALLCALPLVLLMGAWQLFSMLLGSDVLPGIGHLAEVFITHATSDPIIRSQGGGDGGYLPHVAATVLRVVVGVGSGAAVGIVTAFFFFLTPLLREHIEPLLEMLRVIPPLILVPFVLVLLGPTEGANMVVCGIYAGLSMLVHTLNAVENLPSEFWVIAQMHKASRWQIIRTVAWPATLPELLGGMRISLAVALGIVVVSEYLGAPTGIGRVLKFSISFARIDLLVVGVVWAALIGVVFDTVINKVVLSRIRWKA